MRRASARVPAASARPAACVALSAAAARGPWTSLAGGCRRFASRCAAPLHEGDAGAYERHHQRRGEHADDDATAAGAHDLVPVDLGAARRQEPLLVVGELESRAGRPGLGQLEPAAPVQEAGVGPGAHPFVRGGLESASGEQVVAGVVDPTCEPLPLRQQGLVGHFHGGRPARRIAIEREESMAPVLVEHGLQVVGADAQLLQLGPADPPAGVVTVLADVDEAKEHRAGGLASLVVEAVIDRLGPPADRAGETAGFLERGERDHVALPLGEQLGHRVLQEREGAGLQRGLGGDPIHQLRLDLDAHPGGWQPDGIGDLGGGHRSDRHRASLDGIADAGVAERPIEVVGPQRRHEADDARRTARDVHDHLQEGPPFTIIDGLGEQLLELVDDDDQLGALRKDLPGDVVERADRGRQLAGDVRRGDGGDAPERCGQPLEGRLSGHHLGDQPRLGTGERTVGERGQQAGLDHRGLADARRADDDEQTSCSRTSSIWRRRGRDRGSRRRRLARTPPGRGTGCGSVRKPSSGRRVR